MTLQSSFPTTASLPKGSAWIALLKLRMTDV